MLRIYSVIQQLVHDVGRLLPMLKLQCPSLGDQCERALTSIPLNVAEGTHSRGRNRLARYNTAAGSAREVLACLETAHSLGRMPAPSPELLVLFNQVTGTLVRLAVPRGR